MVSTASVYGPSRGLVEKHLSRFGVTASFVDTTDPENVRRAMQPNTRLLYVETPSNPAMQVTTHAQTLARALAEVGVPCPVKGCVLFIREGTIVRLSDRFHRRRVTPVFTRRNRFRLRWYILHRGKRLRRREVRALRRILEDMK